MTETAPAETGTDGRSDWLQWRRGGIGASDISAVLGLSPWQSPWSLWADKVGLLGNNDTDDDAREFGRWAEHMIAPWFEHRTGLHVGYQQERIEHPTLPWARCTLDGRVFDGPNWTSPDDCLGGLEMKTDWQSWSGWDEVPPYYQAQGQWQMFTAGLERVWFPTLHGRRLQVYELARDDADILMLLEKAEEFWVDHVLSQSAPPVDGSDATMTALAEVYPDHTPGDTVTLDDPALEALAGLERARAAKKAAEADERAAKAVLAGVLEDAEEGTVDGNRVVSWRGQNRTGLDIARFKREHPDLAAEYETVTRVRVMRTHKPKESK